VGVRANYDSGIGRSSASEFACSRIEPITQCSDVNKRIVFCWFKSEKGFMYLLAKGRLEQSSMIQSMLDDNFTTGPEGLHRKALILGSSECGSEKRPIKSRRRVGEEERSANFQAEVSPWRRANRYRTLSTDAYAAWLLFARAACGCFAWSRLK